MTCIDGNAMAKKGRAGAALCIAAVGSWVAGTFGVIMLTMVAPPLATIALKFGPPEYTALLVLGLIFLAYMSSTSLVRTLLMACIGLLLGMIGIDNMTGHFRYSFDLAELGDGIGIVPVAVGLFGLGEILSTPSHKVVGEVISPKLRELLPNRQEWRESMMPIARGSVLGFIIGIIPGSAHIISSFLSYALEKRVSKHPEEFGKGAVAGVAGPESANNSASTGAFVPMLALGIPTGPITAVLIGALMMHGVYAGPQLVTEHPDVFWGFVASMYVGNLMLLALNLPLVERVRHRAAHPLRLSLSAHHHVLHRRRLRGEPLDRRRLDHADHGRARLRAAQIRLRSGAAGARPGDRAAARAEPAPVADHVERQLLHLLQPPDRARPADRVRASCWRSRRSPSCSSARTGAPSWPRRKPAKAAAVSSLRRGRCARACSAMAISAVPPNTILMPTSSPIAQAAVLGSPAKIIAPSTRSTTPLASIQPQRPDSSRL